MRKTSDLLDILLLAILLVQCSEKPVIRNTISNGTWQIADVGKDTIPVLFEHSIPFPGQITLTQPSLINPAPHVAERMTIDKNPELFYHQHECLRETYRYHRNFNIDHSISEVDILKVGKAMFGARVFLNGTCIGEHLPCFTPGYVDLKKGISEWENDLIISVGAGRSSIPSDMPDGFDFEKERYISGIFDHVDLILSSTPYIHNVQVAPDIEKKSVRVKTKIFSGHKPSSSKVAFIIREDATNKIEGTFTTGKLNFGVGRNNTIDIEIPIKNCTFWSPEKVKKM
jgi:beta-galactosidase